jgi:Protein of unknown function (DUF2796)
MNPIRPFLPGLALLAAAQALGQGHAHVHGLARLDVVLDGPQLTLALASPLDGIVGFEHRPRTPAQRQAGDAALAKLKDGGALFRAPAEAGCRLESAAVEAPVLQGAAPADGHADLEARWAFRCAAPAQLRTLEQGLFEAFPRLQRLEVQVAGPQGQARHALRRPVRAVPLQR